jgi:hypothetical protein
MKLDACRFLLRDTTARWAVCAWGGTRHAGTVIGGPHHGEIADALAQVNGHWREAWLGASVTRFYLRRTCDARGAVTQTSARRRLAADRA